MVRRAVATMGAKAVSKHLCSFWWKTRGCQKKWGLQCRECFGSRDELDEMHAQVTAVAIEAGRLLITRADKCRAATLDIWRCEAPEKLEGAEAIFKKYFGAESIMYRAVCEKYDEDSVFIFVGLD